MKRIATLLVCAIFLIQPAVLFAQKAGNQSLNVGYVNLDRVLQSYPPYHDAMDKLDQYRNDLQKEIASNRKEIEGLRKELQQGGQFLSKKAQQEKQQELRQRMQVFQQSRQRSQQMLEKKQQEILSPVQKQVQTAVKAVAENLNYDVIHRFGGQQSSTVLWVSPEVDLSDKVIEYLNNNTPDTSTDSQ